MNTVPELMEPDDLQTDNAPYVPTLEEIAAACAAIQLEWSEAERERRSAFRNPTADIHYSQLTGEEV